MKKLILLDSYYFQQYHIACINTIICSVCYSLTRTISIEMAAHFNPAIDLNTIAISMKKNRSSDSKLILLVICQYHEKRHRLVSRLSQVNNKIQKRIFPI